MSDEHSLNIVERLIPVAESAGLSLTHMAIAFVMSHPAITSAIIGPRTMEKFDDLLAGVGVKPDDATLDRIDEIVPPGADIAPLEHSAYVPPENQRSHTPPSSYKRARGSLMGFQLSSGGLHAGSVSSSSFPEVTY